MQDKLLKILKIKMDAINRNIDNLNYLNGELDTNNKDLEYIEKMISSLNEDDILSFDNISKEDFEKILSMIDPSVSEIFKDKTCNYQGIMYIIQGIRQGISLELTTAQHDAILAFLAGMKNKSFSLQDTIDSLKNSKERLPETDLTVLTNDLETYQEIVSKIEKNVYLTEVDFLVEAFDYANILIEEKVELFEFLLKYNANVYNNLNQKKELEEKEEVLDDTDIKDFPYEPININLDPFELPKLEEDEQSDLKLSDSNEIKEVKEENDAIDSENKNLNVFGTFQMPIISEEVLKNPNYSSTIPTPTQPKEEILEIKPTSLEPEQKEEEMVISKSNTVDLEDIIQRIDNKLKEMEDAEKNKEAKELSFNTPIKDLDLETPISNFEEPVVKMEHATSNDYQELFIKYGLNKALELSDSVNYFELDSMLKTLEEFSLLDKLKEKENILKRILNKNTNHDLVKVLNLIKDNLSVGEDSYQNVLEIIIEAMPILLSDPEVITSFAKNIDFFKEHQINLINLFDNYRELLILDHDAILENNMKIEKYALVLNNDNVKYLLYNKHILENLDYFIEAMGREKGFLGKEEVFDGVEYIKKYPYKLNTARNDLLLKLRYQSENNQKIYGSKPGILAGEIANPKVDILQIPEEYKNLYFDYNYSMVDVNEIKTLLEDIKNQEPTDISLDDTLLNLDKKYKESELRYKINSILISRIKTIRIYNFLRSKGIASKNALLIALTYNSVIKNDEYKMLEEVVNSLEGGN